MHLSKTGIILVTLFLSITLIPSIYGELAYGDNNWMWGFIFGGLPWSICGLGMGFFAETSTTSILSIAFIFLGYLLNIGILYLIGIWIEKLYHKIRFRLYP